MCFSATASFTAAAVLAPAGVVSLGRAWRGDRRYLALATLPLLFSVQQFLEGLVWRAGELGDSDAVTRYSLGYMFFSWLAWPFWVPFATYFIEPPRRHWLYLLFAILGGFLGGLQYIPYFAHEDWLVTRFLPHAISYGGTELLGIVIGREFTYAIYLLVVIAPLLLSTSKDAKVFGVLVAIVFIMTYLFFTFAYISVFCFGGAIMSLYLVWRPFSAAGGRRQPAGRVDHEVVS